MFCWNCGNELPDGVNFCPKCGSPAADKLGAALPDTAKPYLPDVKMDDSEACGEQNIEAAAPTADDTIKDFVLRKGHVFVLDGKLRLAGKYYLRKGRRFTRQKGSMEITPSFVSDTSILHNHYIRKRIASLLLTIIFACGTLTAGDLSIQSFTSMNTPHFQEQVAEIENALGRLEFAKEVELPNLDSRLGDIQEESAQLEALLAEYQSGQCKELVKQAAGDLDLKQLFSENFFRKAFEQYLTDLLDAFQNDQKLDEWLYAYYAHTMEIGGNQYINKQSNLDMWFYEMPGSAEKFTDYINNGSAFLHNVYELDLYDLIYYYGRIYLSSSDLMNFILKMPNYAADSAVLVRAYGGNPNPERMSVPGWSSSDYLDFWYDAENYLTRDYPIWTYWGLSAQDFNLDWNGLVDEQAYYRAYVKLMDTIAPGLAVFDMVSYYASDDAYAGMGFDIIGKEAAPTEIALLYLEDHPEAIELLGVDAPTSYDGKIADTQSELQKLYLLRESLAEQKEELAALIAEGDSLYAEYNALLVEIDEYRAEHTENLLIYCCIAGALFFMTAICLILFIRFLKKPVHMMVLNLADGTTLAFNAAFCPKNKLAEFQNRFPGSNPASPQPKTDPSNIPQQTDGT